MTGVQTCALPISNILTASSAPVDFGCVVFDDEGELVEVRYDETDIKARFPDVMAWV